MLCTSACKCTNTSPYPGGLEGPWEALYRYPYGVPGVWATRRTWYGRSLLTRARARSGHWLRSRTKRRVVIPGIRVSGVPGGHIGGYMVGVESM